MPFAETGFTPKWERGACFSLIITMKFVQKESDTINKNTNEKKCVLMKYHVLGNVQISRQLKGSTNITGSKKFQLQSCCKFSRNGTATEQNVIA